jgi:hypothetical protein
VLYPLSYEGRAHPRHQGKVQEHSESGRPAGLEPVWASFARPSSPKVDCCGSEVEDGGSEVAATASESDADGLMLAAQMLTAACRC